MKPIDLRNATWSDCLAHVSDDMRRVHEAWEKHGPGTTRQVSARSGVSLLTLRPRTTDLYKLGLVDLVSREGNEGVYQFCSAAAAEASGAWRERADYSQPAASSPPASPMTGFPTVEAAINSLSIADRAALGARLMARYGFLLKRHESNGSSQLTLIPT